MFTIKKNDTSPAIRATLRNDDCSPINITGASVRFHMIQHGVSAPKIDAAASVVSIGGVVEYSWTPQDTDTPGAYAAEFEVTYADGSVETFPSDGYIRVEIVEDVA